MIYNYYAPAITALFVLFVHRPFITKLDFIKYVVLGSISFVIPCLLNVDNLAVVVGAAAARAISSSAANTTSISSLVINDKVLYVDTVLYVLISVFSVSITCLFTRWHFPITFFVKPINLNAHNIHRIVRYGASTLFVVFAILCQTTSFFNYNVPLAFLSAMVAALWYISGSYFIKRWKAITSACVLSMSFAYIFWCSSITITITASAAKENQKIIFTSYMHCVFLVLFCNTLDYLDTILNTFPYLVNSNKSEQVKLQDATTMSYWIATFQLLMRLLRESEEQLLDASPIEDIKTAIGALGPASRSWKTMAAMFPVNIRQDLCLLYAFFRTADDLVDDAPTPEQCQRNLATIRAFLRDVFYPPTKTSKEEHQQKDETLPAHINWNYYSTLLSNNEDVLAIFRNFARISHCLYPPTMFELTDAWELDLNSGPVRREKDLLDYASLVSGTFGELCTYVMMYKSGRGNWGNTTTCRDDIVLSGMRSTGQCLQLVNIARDILADGLEGRCYVPLQYMQNQTYGMLKVARDPYQIEESILKSYSLRILCLADQIVDKAQEGMDGLPKEVRDGFRATFEIYMQIGTVLRNNSGFPLRARVPKLQQQWIAFCCIYGFKRSTRQ